MTWHYVNFSGRFQAPLHKNAAARNEKKTSARAPFSNRAADEKRKTPRRCRTVRRYIISLFTAGTLTAYVKECNSLKKICIFNILKDQHSLWTFPVNNVLYESFAAANLFRYPAEQCISGEDAGFNIQSWTDPALHASNPFSKEHF